MESMSDNEVGHLSYTKYTVYGQGDSLMHSILRTDSNINVGKLKQWNDCFLSILAMIKVQACGEH